MTAELKQTAATGTPDSSWQPYPAYKDSGVEWLGEMPEHWEILKLKYTDRVIMGQSPSSEDYNDTHSGLPFLQGNAEFGKINPNPKIWCETANKTASGGDVLVSVRAPIGAVNMADQEYGIGRGLCAIRPIKSNNKYLYYFFISLNDELNSIGTGSTYTAISVDEVENIKIPYAELPEQRSIAIYLDDRTQKIDSLIEKKQKLIELLKEERAAVINYAVTKGLNPDAPMKDSGIEWLGEVPEKWEVKRLKWISYINPVKSNSQFDKNSEDLATFLPMEKVSEDGKIDTEIKKQIKDLWNGFTYFEENDIIVAKITPCFENGKGALIKNLGSKVGFGSTEFHVLRSKENIIKELLYYLTKSDIFMKLGEASMTGAAGQKRVTNSFLEDFYFCYSKDIGEQNEIVRFIESETTRIDSAVSRIEKELVLLQEYHTALISEVVTGKIDVRGE